MKRTFCVLIMALGVVSNLSAAEKSGSAGRTFSNFSGVCHGSIKNNHLWGKAIGWNRFDFAWHASEPAKGKWNQKYLNKMKKMITAFCNKNVKFLPILDYSAPWAAECPDQDFELAGQRFVMKKQADGSFQMSVFNKSFIDGKEQWEQALSRKISKYRMGTRWLSKNNVYDWKNFVRKIVSTYRKAPYNLEYFQIWNEAWPTSSFWYGNMDAYMTHVHIPAAEVIHELGGKVVYGGWICGAPISEFVKYMDKYKAWDTVDVIDLHYFPISSMDYVYRELKKRGLEDKGIWQTELGFTSDPNFIGNTFPRVLYWGLQRKWDWADKYKLFYFAYGTPDDPKAYGYKRGLLLGKKLNMSGRSLLAMADVFGDGELEAYDNVSSKPVLKAEMNEKLSSMESFRVGSRIICAVHILPSNNAKIFVDWNSDQDTLHVDYDKPMIKLSFSAINPKTVASIERVSMYGSKIELTRYLRAEKTGFSVTVPIREPDAKEFKYTDMPESFLPEVFYTVINLKK